MPEQPMTDPTSGHTLRVRRIGIETYQEPVVFIREDSHVCRSEGFESQSRVELRRQGNRIIATLNVVRHCGIVGLGADEAGLSEAAWRILGAGENETIRIGHPAPVDSFALVRAKLYGHAFSAAALHDVVDDIGKGRYSSIELAAFVAACSGDRVSMDETIALTRAMVATGERLHWAQPMIMDKHCVGGLPGNRTTLIVVPIIAALGLVIPKTSSRAITSPAGTADTMETLAPVSLDVAAMRRVVEREGGCIAWGGAIGLSPADDILIRVERPLDLDSEAQLVMIETGRALDLKIDVVLTDGRQPVGRGIGPALEARDVLSVLQDEPAAPADLRERALTLAGRILELAQFTPTNTGAALAQAVLADGRAWRKFQAIADAQGGLRAPPVAPERHVVSAPVSGAVTAIDNRRLSRIAKLAGAPLAPAAGVDLHVVLGSTVEKNQPLYTVHAQSRGELQYAIDYALAQHDVIAVEAAP